jgi:hypothetical protein
MEPYSDNYRENEKALQCQWIKTSSHCMCPEVIVKVFKQCYIFNIRNGRETYILWEDEEEFKNVGSESEESGNGNSESGETGNNTSEGDEVTDCEKSETSW